MKNPTIKIVNAQTGEEIEREMDEAELRQFEADCDAYKKEIEQKASAAAAKAALLAKLGITEEEAKLLLS